ncbi:MAG: carboxypeptidase regulatory-like domain-containing protein [Acidobacteriota bacterium]|nr:carboxypeptidase regulatory-like domain-containing protein [Acidobacteriota bacterium]
MAMRVPALVACLSMLCLGSSAQELPPAEGERLIGRVLTLDGQPVPGATLILEKDDRQRQQMTNQRGAFEFRGLPIGTYNWSVDINNITNHGKTHVVPGQHLQDLIVPITAVEPTWNSWLKDRANDKTVTNDLVVNGNYKIIVDLAGVQYSKFTTEGAVAADVEEDLKNLLEGSDSEIPILVKPFIQGEGLAFDEKESSTQPLKIIVTKLRKTQEELRELSDSERMDLAILSEKLHAVRIEVNVHATKPGTATVGLAIFDNARKQVLDFVGLSVTVDLPSVLNSNQATTPPVRLQSGRRFLLRSPGESDARAGIGIFELDSRGPASPNTVVFLGPYGDLLSWNPRRSIREFVTDSGQGQFGLTRQLEFAHCPSLAPRSCREDYRQLETIFSGIVFSAPDAEGREAAQAAKEELEQLVEDEHFPVVATRFIDTLGSSLPLPLGLLGMSKDRLLGDLAYVTQPLPVERPGKVEHCIRFKDFKVAIPNSLGLGADECERADLDRLLKPIVAPSAPFLADFDTLEQYLAPSDDVETGRQEGLLLIAHHADGFISFNPQFSPAMQSENMTRQFAPGSAAVLIGCTVSGLRPLNRSLPLIRTLNENGIDAMIFSPFNVNVELGSRLAVHFADELEAARRSETPVTFLQLYKRVLRKTRHDDIVRPFLKELSEFSLVGNGNLEICAEDEDDATVEAVAALPERRLVCLEPIRTLRRMFRRMLGGGGGIGGGTGSPKSGFGAGGNSDAP